jgi:hypothetical protein
MKNQIALFELSTSRRALLASALVITALLGPATIQSVKAKPGDGNVQPFVCGEGGGFQADFVTVPNPFGFGTSDKAIHVVNDGNATATAGCLLKNFKTVSPNRTFQNLQIMFTAPAHSLKRLLDVSGSEDVIIGACFDTPTGLTVSVETPLIRFNVRPIRGGWFLAEITAAGFGLPNNGFRCIAKSIWMRLFGRGNIQFGDTRINYVGAVSDLRPQDPITTPASCPVLCEPSVGG